MGKTGYVPTYIKTIAVIFNRIANGNIMPCPIEAIENYYRFVNGIIVSRKIPSTSKVSIVKTAGKLSDKLKNGKYLETVQGKFLFLNDCGTTQQEVAQMWRREISPHLTSELLDELTGTCALKELLGSDSDDNLIKKIREFARCNTQQLNPFIIALVLTIESFAKNVKHIGRRTSIDRYVQALIDNIGDKIENITIDDRFAEFCFWNGTTNSWTLHDNCSKNSIEENDKLWLYLAETLAEQSPEFLDAAFDEEVLKKLLGEDTSQENIDRVIQFVTENTPQKGHAKALLPQSTSTKS